MATSLPNIEELQVLSTFITSQIAIYVKALAANTHAVPSPPLEANDKAVHENLKKKAQLITNACAQLTVLIADPSEWVLQAAWSYCDSVAISLAIEIGIPKYVKLGEASTSLAELADHSGASPSLISKLNNPWSRELGVELIVNRAGYATMYPSFYIQGSRAGTLSAQQTVGEIVVL